LHLCREPGLRIGTHPGFQAPELAELDLPLLSAELVAVVGITAKLSVADGLQEADALSFGGGFTFGSSGGLVFRFGAEVFIGVNDVLVTRSHHEVDERQHLPLAALGLVVVVAVVVVDLVGVLMVGDRAAVDELLRHQRNFNSLA